MSSVPVRLVHVVAKTHLDLGFTALASEVEDQYLTDFFPRAVAVAAELVDRGGRERLCWTTGSWILDRALQQADGARARAVDDAVRAGALAWHALPLTTHTELMDAALFRSGLSISRRLDDWFGTDTTAAKMTDVPGHTRSMVPLLAEAGVTFLHLGVNPAWPVPEVPPVFRWQAPGGAEVTVAYQAGGYGGEVLVPGCDHVLAFRHGGDNLGPPSVDDVLTAHARLRERYPDAEVRASTLDAFARALAGSGAIDSLPVVTAEIGDPWLFGAGSDPQKVATYRGLLAGPGRTPAVDAQLLLVAEHTWGLDQKVALPDDHRWGRDEMAKVRASAEGRRFEASWAEQRGYVDAAAEALDRSAPARDSSRSSGPGDHAATVADLVAGIEPWPLEPRDPLVPLLPLVAGYRRIAPDEVVETDVWSIAVGQDGSVRHLVAPPEGRLLADHDHPLGLLVHQTFAEVDYERFYAQLAPAPDDAWWARRDNTKPGIDACGAASGTSSPRVVTAWFRGASSTACAEVVVSLRFGWAARGLGAPFEAWTRWRLADDGRSADVEVWCADKPASRLPEAMWCSFVPIVDDPTRWEIDKLGQRVSPLDIVRRGGRSLHAVGEGMHHDGPDGGLTIATPDAPLVAPGAPNLLDADPPLPDLAGGFHVLLHDNCWGTNFPMWNEGPARFRFVVQVR